MTTYRGTASRNCPCMFVRHTLVNDYCWSGGWKAIGLNIGLGWSLALSVKNNAIVTFERVPWLCKTSYFFLLFNWIMNIITFENWSSPSVNSNSTRTQVAAYVGFFSFKLISHFYPLFNTIISFCLALFYCCNIIFCDLVIFINKHIFHLILQYSTSWL